MKKQLTALSLVAVVGLFTAVASANVPTAGLTSPDSISAVYEAVPYTEAKRYFVKSTYNKTGVRAVKVTSQEKFDEIFGMAATMGEGGTPTAIDFSNSYVIALIGELSDRQPVLTVESLTQDGKNLQLNYKYEKGGEKQTYSVRPVVIMVVDNQHEGSVKLKKVN